MLLRLTKSIPKWDFVKQIKVIFLSGGYCDIRFSYMVLSSQKL